MPIQRLPVGLVLVGVIVVSVLLGGMFFNTEPSEPVSADMVRSFEVDNVSASHEDGVLSVSAEITNTAPDVHTGTVSLKLDRDGDGTFETTAERREITFESSERRVVAFEQTTERMENGQYQYAVFVNSEETAVEAHSPVIVDIQQPPLFQLSAVPETIEVVNGESVTVSFDVTNVGDETRSRIVSIVVDANGDGRFETSESAAVTVLELESSQTETVELTVSTAALETDTYAYRVRTETDARDGTMTVLQPATFIVDLTSVPENVTKGEPLNTSVAVSNTGDVSGTTVLAVGFVDETGNVTESVTENVTLSAGEEWLGNVSLATANESRGNSTVLATVGTANDSATVYVKDTQFEVTRLRHDKTSYGGDDLSVEVKARITNTGDITGRELVSLRVDLDGDDTPERIGVNESLKLAPGESETVTFELKTEMSSSHVPLKLPVGTYVYGVFTEYEGETGAFAIEGDPSSGSDTADGSPDDTVDDSSDPKPSQYATLSEITQSKYGIYYEQLSGETIAQVDELFARQPFAPGYSVSDVLTREEIARQKYDVETPNHHFDFALLDVELQQQIEADFDAQFLGEEGDRYESWEELAQSMYGTDFDSLTDEQQQQVKERYDEQFD